MRLFFRASMCMFASLFTCDLYAQGSPEEGEESAGDFCVTGVSVDRVKLTVVPQGANVYSVSGFADFSASCDLLNNIPLSVTSKLELSDIAPAQLRYNGSMNFDVAPNTRSTWTINSSDPQPIPSVHAAPGTAFRAYAKIQGLRYPKTYNDGDVDTWGLNPPPE